MLSSAGNYLARLAGYSFTPNGVHLQAGRTVLALGTLTTVLFNSDAALSHNPDPLGLDFYKCSGAAQLGLFCLSSDTPTLARSLIVIACCLSIFGLLPALSGIMYWYSAASVFANIGPVDGGDQITACLAFILALVGITDRRLWGWRRAPSQQQRWSSFANGVWLLIPIQVAFVYLNSAIAKFSAPVWVDGTGLWYWIQHPAFNASQGVLDIGLDVLEIPTLSALFTWGVIGFELGLAAVILFGHSSRRLRLYALVAGVVFHIAIAVIIGLISFCSAMCGALVLALWRPRDAMPWRLFRLARPLHRIGLHP